MNLQELLLHMHPALAGVIVPTIALIGVAAIPYLDRSTEAQGIWFGTKNSVRTTLFSSAYAAWFTVWLILFDQGRHTYIYEKVTGKPWLGDKNLPDWLPAFFVALWELMFVRNTRSIQTEWSWSICGNLVETVQGGGHDGCLNWPQDLSHIPMPFNGTSWPKWGADSGEPPPGWYQDLPGWLTGLFWYDLNLNLPAFIVEIALPTAMMVGLSVLLIYLLWRVGWVNSRRDVVISLFTGFMTVYWVLTIVGSTFRGAAQDLVLPWDVPKPDG
jgi:hypothetical protein